MVDEFEFEKLNDAVIKRPIRLAVTIPDPYVENQSIVVSTPTERLLLMILAELQELRASVGKSEVQK
jgi:hypothetical protein